MPGEVWRLEFAYEDDPSVTFNTDVYAPRKSWWPFRVNQNDTLA